MSMRVNYPLNLGSVRSWMRDAGLLGCPATVNHQRGAGYQ